LQPSSLEAHTKYSHCSSIPQHVRAGIISMHAADRLRACLCETKHKHHSLPQPAPPLSIATSLSLTYHDMNVNDTKQSKKAKGHKAARYKLTTAVQRWHFTAICACSLHGECARSSQPGYVHMRHHPCGCSSALYSWGLGSAQLPLCR